MIFLIQKHITYFFSNGFTKKPCLRIRQGLIVLRIELPALCLGQFITALLIFDHLRLADRSQIILIHNRISV